MWLNLLAEVVDKKRSVPVGEAALYALLGFAVTFAGIALLIFIVWLVGKIMVKFTTKKQTKTEVSTMETVASDEEEISEETVAAITAAIMAYYQEEQPKCEFRVKRIKKV